MKRLALFIFLLLSFAMIYIFLGKSKNIEQEKQKIGFIHSSAPENEIDWKAYIDTILTSPKDLIIEKLRMAEDTMQKHLASDDYAFAYLYHKTGVQYYRRREMETASTFYEKALLLRQQYPDSLTADEIANTYYNLGSVHLYRSPNDVLKEDSLYNRALFYYQEALELRKKNTELPYRYLRNTYNQLAITYRHQGDSQRELKYRKAAANVMDTVVMNMKEPTCKEKIALALSLRNVGLSYERLGDYSQALDYFQQAIELFNICDYQIDVLETKGKIAEVYLHFELEKSLKIYQYLIGKYQALYEAENYEEDAIALANAYHNAGLACQELQQQDSAIVYFEHSLSINQGIAEREVEIRNNFESLASSYRRLMKYDTALNYLNSSLKTAQAAKDWQYLSGTYENIGEVYYAQEDYRKTLQNYQKAIQYLIPAFGDTTLSSNPSLEMLNHNKIDLTRVLSLKALTFKSKFDKTGQIDDLNDALNSFSLVDTLITQIRQSFQNTDSKFLLQQNIKPIYESAIQSALELYKYSKNEKYIQTAYHFCAKNKAIVLLEGIQHEIAQFKGLPTEVLNQEQDFIEKITQLESELSERKNKQDSLQVVSQLFNVKRAYENFIEGLEEQYPRYYELKYSAQQPETIENIQAKLEENRAAVEYFVGVDDIYIFVVSRHDFNYYKLSKSKNFNKHYDTFRRDILEQQDDYDFLIYKDIANQLYQVLLEQPLQDLDSTITRLTFIPDEELLSLSFDVLPYRIMTNEDRNKPPYLIRKWATSLAYSNRLLFDNNLKQRFKNYQKKFGGFALDYKNFGQKKWNLPDSLYLQNRDMDELPYSVREIRQAGSLYKNTAVFINEQATRTAFLQETKSTNYKVLHLAMHGIVLNERPLQSGLVFYQEKDTLPHILRAREIYAQNISTDLLILSACNTGYGAISTGEGIRSLARSFAYAGCPSIMASLWTANDMSSKEITLPFHQFIKDGLPKDVALQSAKLTYLDRKNLQANFKNPYYWAHFAVIGDVGAVFEAGSFGIWGMLFFVFVVGLFLMYIRLWR